MAKDDLTLWSIGQLNGKVPLQPQFLTVNILSQKNKNRMWLIVELTPSALVLTPRCTSKEM